MEASKGVAVLGLPIGALSKRADCNIGTIRYYERIGLMPKPPRTSGGRRAYEESHVRRLTFIRRSRALGFTLDEVRGLLKLVGGEHYTCEEVNAITLNHLVEVKRKITDLKRMATVLQEMAAQCAGGTVPDCPIVDALERPRGA
ncbi:MAG: MerR family mercuric resistance operon transcriptional regulator [Gammaproteobacteria bacterium]